MKTNLLVPVTMACFSLLPCAWGQGSLTPPSAPGPTMVTLSQIEPRTPISSAPYGITQPGSYYLTTNLTVGGIFNAITINTNNVMLDLNGFSISSVGTGGNGAGIYINSSGGALENIMILNGFIQSGVTNNGSGVYSGNGFNWGIYCNGSSVNIRVSGVSVSGVLDYGIFLGMDTSILVENCEVHTAGSYGIIASTVKQSSAIDCGSFAIFANDVSDCQGQCSGASYGILAYGIAQNCYGTGGNDGYGVVAGTAQDCYGTCGTNGDGISGNCALNCFGSTSSGGSGVSAGTAQNCYGTCGSGGNGVSGGVLQNCYGSSSGGGNGIYTEYLAIGCYGYNSSGTGVNAYIANCCYSSSGDGSITYKYNMP